MSILILHHSPLSPPGRLGLTLRDHGRDLDIRRLDLPESAANPHIPRDFDGIDAVVSLGGPQNVGEDHSWMSAELEFLAAAHKQNLPLVGICLGCQMIAKALGGEVGPMDNGAEWGMVPVNQHPIANTDIILAGIPWRMWQFQAHGQEVKKLPPGAALLQSSAACKVQSFRAGIRTYAFQYHFECDFELIEALVDDAADDLRSAGADPAAILRDAETHYDDFARVSDRLSVNLASFLFPVSRAILA